MFKVAVLATVLASALATIVVHAPKADLTLEVARTENQREQGLMNRRVVMRQTGMLFVFERDEEVDFWMKDTLVPLDMIFIAADGTVRRVFSNVKVVAPTLPDEQIPREGAQAKYVIELAAGEASTDGIVAGVKLDLREAPPAQ
ncbi:MAG TPA: DUF192 domain-containing protein [Candidatus Cybelea sp.]|nr:DUF192 domain-containing protein [Candidatus Cybelea sp.]